MGTSPSAGTPRAIPALILTFFAVDLLLGLLCFVDVLANRPFYYVSEVVDLGSESGFGTWYSTMKLMLVAVMLGFFAWRNITAHGRAAWPLVLLPAIFLVFSIDEIIQLHEYVGYKTDALLEGGDRKNTVFDHTGVWGLAIGVPVLALLVGIMLSLRRWFADAPGVVGKFVMGAVVFIAAAAGLDLMANFFDEDARQLAIQVTIEETLELIGVTIFIWAALRTPHSIRLRPAIECGVHVTSQSLPELTDTLQALHHRPSILTWFPRVQGPRGPSR